MTDLTSPGRLEGQAAVKIPGRMTGETGKPLVTGVGKTVRRRGWGGGPRRLVTPGTAGLTGFHRSKRS